MKPRFVLIALLVSLALYVALTLPEKLMLINLEYVGGNEYPIATYSDNFKKHDAIVKLLHNSFFICSAVVISDQYAITAAHCVMEKGNIVVGNYAISNNVEETATPAEVAFVYAIQDIAIMNGDFKDYATKKVDWTGKLLNKKFGKTCGFPQGQKELLCSEYEIKGNRFFFIRGDGNIWQGCSGGPLLVDDTVLGVNSHVGLLSVMVGPVVGIQELFKVFL